MSNLEQYDVLYQLQWITIERFNRYLSKLDRDQLLTDIDYQSTLTMVAGDNLLNFLQEMSIETGMSLEDVAWQELLPSRKEKKNGRLREYSLDLNLSGSYFSFINFLFSLEKSSRLINIVESKFSIPSEENEPISFDIILKVYSY